MGWAPYDARVEGGILLRIAEWTLRIILDGGNAFMAQQLTAVRKMIGDFAPKLAELTEQVLFGDV